MTSQSLKRGFTTGAAAAAAAKAALLFLLETRGAFDTLPPTEKRAPLPLPPGQVEIRCLNDEWISIEIHQIKKLSNSSAEAVVIKDAGDDPDVTHKAEIGARVLLLNGDLPASAQLGKEFEPCTHGNRRTLSDHSCTRSYHSRTSSDCENINLREISIHGGKGVGVVTKPGLEVPPGTPAINPGPRKMILEAVESVLETYPLPAGKRVVVEIFVPQGEALAQKTLNARLGVMGGISILGTTGIVKPMSHDAYIATIQSGISVARAMDINTLVFTTGRRSERFAMELFPDLSQEAFIQTGDFFKASLESAANLPLPEVSSKNIPPADTSISPEPQQSASTCHGPYLSEDRAKVSTVIITVFFGKAVKMAMGFPHTHAAKSELTMKKLAQWAKKLTGSGSLQNQIAQANTARHAFTYIHPHFPELISHVGERIVQSATKFSNNALKIRSIIFDFEGNTIFDSSKGAHNK